MTLDEIIEKTKDIPSSVTEAEQELWYKYRNKDIHTVVDFGTGWGKSAKSLALTFPKATVITFDTGVKYIKQGNVKDMDEYYLTVCNNLKDCPNILFGVENSLHTEVPPKIDLLNFDSHDSDTEYTKQEMARFLPNVVDGGLVFFHDYVHYKNPEVRNAIDKYLPEEFKLIDTADCSLYTVGLFLKLPK